MVAGGAGASVTASLSNVPIGTYIVTTVASSNASSVPSAGLSVSNGTKTSLGYVSSGGRTGCNNTNMYEVVLTAAGTIKASASNPYSDSTTQVSLAVTKVS